MNKLTKKDEGEKIGNINRNLPENIKGFNLKINKFESEVNGVSKTIIMKTYSKSELIFGQRVKVSFNPDHVKVGLKKYASDLKLLIDWIKKNRKNIEDKVADKLLKLKNSTWLEDGEDKLNELDFIRRIKLEDIQFFNDYSFELYFDDGNIFLGYSIIYAGDSEGRIRDIYIAG